jgi:Uncharacterized protein family UPF0029
MQAHVAPVETKKQVQEMLAALQRNNSVATAHHNMHAYRIAEPGQTTCMQDFDDDGEKGAGKRLLQLLQVRLDLSAPLPPSHKQFARRPASSAACMRGTCADDTPAAVP